MNILNGKLVFAAIFSTLFFIVGCEGSSSTSKQVVNSAAQLPIATDLITGEALAGRTSDTSQTTRSEILEPGNTDSTADNNRDVGDQELTEQESLVDGGFEVPSVSIEQYTQGPEFGAVHDAINFQDFDDVSYAWFKNGKQFTITEWRRLYAGVASVVRGDTIAVALRLSRNGETLSSVSPEVVVKNTPPRFLFAKILPENATNRDTLIISAEVDDYDGDDLEITYSWEGYDDEGDTLVGSNVFPLNPLIIAYVTVSDGIDQTSYKVTKQLNIHGYFYSEHSELELVFDQPVSFRVGYKDDDVGDVDTKLLSGPPGMTYDDGMINWTPSPMLRGEKETFYAHFQSASDKVNTIELVVTSPDAQQLVWKWETLDHIEYDNALDTAADCELSVKIPSSSSTLCLVSEGHVACGKGFCESALFYELQILDHVSAELDSIPLWFAYNKSYYSDRSEEISLTRGEYSLPVLEPIAMGYLSTSNELLFIDSENRLSLFSASTGHLTWFAQAPASHSGPASPPIKKINCQLSDEHISQCEFLTGGSKQTFIGRL